MLNDFERKLKQIIINDRTTRRVTTLDDLEQRTGHDREEIEQTIEKLKKLRKSEGGLR
ncbi:MAG: hypothetical protein ABF497_05375 [Sporolactobacillus sp.]